MVLAAVLLSDLLGPETNGLIKGLRSDPRLLNGVLRTGRILRVVFALLPILTLCFVVTAQSRQPKRVLILLENDVSWPIFRRIDQSARATLNEGSPGGILIFSEHLDRVHFPNPAIQAEQMAWIKKKYANSNLDLVIGVGDVPTDLFPAVPLVFVSADTRRRLPNSVISAGNVASVWIGIDAQKTLEVARRLQPRARRIVVIGEGSPSDDTIFTHLRSTAPTTIGDMPVTYVTNASVPAIIQSVSELGPDSIVLFTALTRDESGHPLISAEVIPKIAAASGAPVYALFDTHVGTGAVGGYVASFADIGKAGGEMGLRILAGEHPQDVIAQNVYLFDWRQLRRWNIPESALPAGSLVLYRQPTAWELYRKTILGSIALFLLQALLIFGLLWQRAKKRKVEGALVERLAFEQLVSDLSKMLINLPEDQLGEHMRKILGRIGEFLKLDWIVFFEFSQEKSELMGICSWDNEGARPGSAFATINKYPWWTSRTLRGEIVLASDLNDLPGEPSAEREQLQRNGAKSLAMCPLKSISDCFGSIVFVSTKRRVTWSDDVVKQIKILTEILSNALMRKRARQDRFRNAAIVDSSDDAIISKNLEGIILSWNASAQRIFGFTEDEAVGRSITFLIPPELCNEENMILQTLRNGQSIKHFETLRVTKGGEKIHVSLTISPIKDSAGAVIGISKIARDITERKLAEKALHELSGQLINAQDKERNLIARELHDDICQRLALISAKMEHTIDDSSSLSTHQRQTMSEIREQCSKLAGDVQALSHELHSSILDHLGLVSAAENFCREFSVHHSFRVEFTARDVPLRLPHDISLTLFRVLQEALRNAFKHSGANYCFVHVGGSLHEVSLEIRDQGIGFDAAKAKLSGGIGLLSMQERLNLLHGTLKIESNAGTGTRIRVSVPLAGSRAVTQTKAAAYYRP